MKKKKKPVFKPTIRLLIKNYMDHGIGKSAAALTYYLLFAIFPLLIFLCNLLGLLDLNVNAITQALQQILPTAVVELVESYLEYVTNTSSQVLFWFSLVFSVWFPMRAVGGLMDDVRLAYQLPKPKNPIQYTIRQFLYTVMLLVVMVLTLFLTTMGRRVLSFLLGLLPDNIVHISESVLAMWQYFRFIPVGVLMVAALGTLYAASLDKRQKVKTILPGILVALSVWMIASICFSFYVENFAKYSIIYGTLGTVIVLLLWLNITSLIFILGAELNAALLTVHKKNAEEEKAESLLAAVKAAKPEAEKETKLQ